VVARLRTEWTGLPRWARWVLAAYLAGFADGTAAHVRALAQGGIHAYSAFSQVPLQVFFVCLNSRFRLTALASCLYCYTNIIV
jgi:hypothetical protein